MTDERIRVLENDSVSLAGALAIVKREREAECNAWLYGTEEKHEDSIRIQSELEYAEDHLIQAIAELQKVLSKCKERNSA